MPQQFGDPSKGHDCREGSSSFFFQQLVLSEHMAKKITNPKGGRIVTRQDCSRHVKITRTHLFLLTCFVILIYLYLTISSVNLQPINEDFEVLRSNNNDLVLLEMKRKRVIEGEYSGKIPWERNSQKVHSARQEQQHTSLLRRPSDYKSSEDHIVKLSISADQSNRLKGQFYRQPNNTTSDNVLQKISNHNYNVYAHLQRDKDPTNKSNQENGSIPPAFQNIASFPSERRTGDIPIFWHIPKSAGSTMKDILAGCLQMTIASEVGHQYGHSKDDSLQVFEVHGAKYVNVDTTIFEGILKAKSWNLTSSGIVDAIVVTSFLYDASELFSQSHRGKFFTVMRDPIERAVSLLNYLGQAKWERNYDPAFASMTIEDHVQRGRVPNNWMVRWLSNQREGPLSEQHLIQAKEILREKFLIGMLSQMDKSFQHFEKYFSWQIINRPFRKKCVEELIEVGANRNALPHQLPITAKGYDALVQQNELDIQLYKYAEQLFTQQSTYFDDVPRPLVGTLK